MILRILKRPKVISLGKAFWSHDSIESIRGEDVSDNMYISVSVLCRMLRAGWVLSSSE